MKLFFLIPERQVNDPMEGLHCRHLSRSTQTDPEFQDSPQGKEPSGEKGHDSFSCYVNHLYIHTDPSETSLAL